MCVCVCDAACLRGLGRCCTAEGNFRLDDKTENRQTELEEKKREREIERGETTNIGEEGEGKRDMKRELEEREGEIGRE